jgi:TPR repeat protein
MPSASAVLLRISFCLVAFISASPAVWAQNHPTAPSAPEAVASMQADHAANLSAAQQGVLEAQLKVAKNFNRGVLTNGATVVRRNYPKAFQWFQAATQQGSVEAGAWLGSMYVLGHGVAQDEIRGAEMIQSAADHGDATGLLLAGVIRENGQGVNRDYSKAFDYYSQSMAKGEIRAFDRLGSLYLAGHGTEKNVVQAFVLFNRGAALGDAKAQLHLAEIYYSGHIPQVSLPGTNQSLGSDNRFPGSRELHRKPVADYVTAAKLYGQAAAQGNRVAAFRLARMYEAGNGVPQDYGQAFEYYRQSAHGGFAPALVALGQAHEIGRGTDVNLLHAYVAYKLAIEHSNQAAAQLLDSVTKRMTSTQVDQAEVLLQDYKKRTAPTDDTE